MAGKIKVRYEIPADVETAYAAISGDGWAPAKAEKLGDGSVVQSRTEGAGGAVTLVIERNLPDNIPGFLTKFLPSGGRVKQTDTWGAAVGGVRNGTWTTDTPGSPAKVDGTMRLEPSGAGCAYIVEGTAKVSIPLIGGKAEGVVVGLTEKITAQEADVLRGLVS
jgi:hypothetical protein